MKNRKTFAMICYVICVIACHAAGVVSFMAYSQKITYTLGFLLFVPIWICAYWFLSFFNALSREKNGKKVRYVVKKSLTKGLSAAANVMSVLLLCFWVYAYIFMVLPANKGGNDTKAGALQTVSVSVQSGNIN